MPDAPHGGRAKPTLPPDSSLEELIHEPSPEILTAVAADGRLTEDLALALLNRRDLPREALEELNRNSSVAKHRKVRLAVVKHPQTPRHVSLPTIRHLYTFELMQVALAPAVPADIKRAAEDVLASRLGTVTSGERFALAKQSSGRVAAALLHDAEERIVLAALANPRMTEALIVRALRSQEPTALLASAVCRNHKWSQRLDIRIALLGNENTPFARVLEIANGMPVRALREVLAHSRLSANVKAYLNSLIARKA